MAEKIGGRHERDCGPPDEGTTGWDETQLDTETRVLVKSDQEECIYCKVTFKEDRIVGCILLGEVEGRKAILSAVENKVKVEDLKNSVPLREFTLKLTWGAPKKKPPSFSNSVVFSG